MSEPFTIGLTRDFLDANGELTYDDIGLGLVEAEGGAVAYRYLESYEDELTPEQVEGLDALFLDEPLVTPRSLAGADRLKVISRFGVGYDGVDVAACTEADVAVTNTPGAPSHPVAEANACLMLAISHHLLIKDNLTRTGRWNERYNYMGSELRDRVVGYVGLGRIARRTMDVLSGFGMAQPIAYHPRMDEEALRGLGVRKVDLPTLLQTADFVLVCTSLNDTSRGMIGEAELALMRPDAYLINTARGPIVDEKALHRCLTERRIAGAALDVYSVEPIDASVPPFAELENVILTPHALSITHECVRDMGQIALGSILDVYRGKHPFALLNPEVWDRPGFQQKLGKKG